MLSEKAPQIERVDQVRDGIVVTFSDEVTVFYPAEFMLAIRDRKGNCRLLPAEDGY
jgi:hypothetical protein